MTEMFGRTWTDRYTDEPGPAWVDLATQLTDGQIRRGIRAVLNGYTGRYVPTMVSFRAACLDPSADGGHRQPVGRGNARFINPIPVDQIPKDENGNWLPWWAYIDPELAQPLVTDEGVVTYRALKAQHYDSQPYLATTETHGSAIKNLPQRSTSSQSRLDQMSLAERYINRVFLDVCRNSGGVSDKAMQRMKGQRKNLIPALATIFAEKDREGARDVLLKVRDNWNQIVREDR